MNIGDLFMRVLADDTGFAADLKQKAGKAGDAAGLSLSARMGAAVKKTGSGILSGIGIGAGIAAFGGLESAVDKVVSVLFDAVAAARADEESISTLSASLKANIPNWDGNTTAIERVIKANRALGFSDEEQRISLAGLVGATHDVTKALDIQRVAMDLARFKHISLAEAGQALTKVEAGSYRILKSLGIVLKDGATSADALAAVEAVAAGQAADFAATNEGKLLVSQDKVNESMEKIGYKIMPVVADVMVAAADAITTITDVIITAVEAIGPFVTVLGQVNDKLGEIGQTVPGAAGAFDLMKFAATLPLQPLFFLKDRIDDAANSAHHFGDTATDMADAVATVDGPLGKATVAVKGLDSPLGRAAAAFDSVGAAAQGMKDLIKFNADWIANRIKELTATLLGEATKLISGYYDPIIAQDDLRVQKDTIATNQIAVNAARIALSKTKAGTEERRQAQLTLDQALLTQHQSQAALDQTRLNLLAAGELSKKDQQAWLTDLQKKYKTATGDARKKIGELIAKIKELQNVPATVITVSVDRGTGQFGKAGEKRATGGPVVAGRPYLVNENTPRSEIWVPDVSGRVLSGAVPAASAPTTVVYNYNNTANVTGLVKAASPLEIARQLGRFARNGQLTPMDVPE